MRRRWATVRVDKAFAAQLAKMSPTIQFSSRGHTPTKEGAEHALEVQLPWLQRVLGDFTLVPIVMGNQSYENSRALGVALAKLIHGQDTLIVASSDLSHYHPYDDAVKIDHKTLNALQQWDYFSMSRNFEERVWEACGGAPIVAAMIAAERMGANEARVLKYANTGDVTGDHSRVVGYSADVFLKTQGGKTVKQPFSLNAHEKSELLALARKSVEYAVHEGKLYDSGGKLKRVIEPGARRVRYFEESGRIARLHRIHVFAEALVPDGARHGCIRRAAATLAFRRCRPRNCRKLEYEISVLSPMRRVLDVRQIKVGEHGLLMKDDTHEGLLLPQVPVEEKWDRQEFLEETCAKAKMRASCWKDENTDIFQFTAVVFGDTQPQALTPETPLPPMPPARPGAQAPGLPPH